jgi:hypothetical protein
MGWGVLTTIAPSFFTIKRLKPLDSKAFDGVVTPSGKRVLTESDLTHARTSNFRHSHLGYA